MKIIKNVMWLSLINALLFSSAVNAELQAIDDDELSQTIAQGGLYLSGEFSLNENGGPIDDATYDSCDGAASSGNRCGARFAYRLGGNDDNGWYVVDDWRGEVSFEGLTLRTRRIDGNKRDIAGQLVDVDGNSVDQVNAVALGNNDGFGGDGASFDKEVLEIGLPSSVKFRDYQYTLGYASHASPGDSASYQQTNIYGVQINGKVNMTGNMLIFPTADK